AVGVGGHASGRSNEDLRRTGELSNPEAVSRGDFGGDHETRAKIAANGNRDVALRLKRAKLDVELMAVGIGIAARAPLPAKNLDIEAARAAIDLETQDRPAVVHFQNHFFLLPFGRDSHA